MAVLLKAGQAVSRPAVVAILDWDATGSEGHVQLAVDPLPESAGAAVAAPKEGRLAVSHLLGPVVVVARPADGSARFDPGTTVALRVRLRGPGGEEDDLATARVDLSAGPGQPLLRITPEGPTTWEVRAEAVEADLRLPQGVRDAYYAARRAGSYDDRPGEEPAAAPLLAVDVSASMTRPLQSGLVQDVVAVVTGVCARRMGAGTDIPVAAAGMQAHLVAHPVRAEAVDGFVAAQLRPLEPSSGFALAPIVELAGRGGHQWVVVVSDEAPPDLQHIAAALDADPSCHVTLILLGTSRWAAHPDDRPRDRETWREQADVLEPLVESGRLGVLAVPATTRLAGDRAQSLAERLVVELAGSNPASHSAHAQERR